jgi:hypothetical protein
MLDGLCGSLFRGAFGDHVRAAVAPTETDPAALPAMRREIDDILRVTTAHTDAPSVAGLTDVHARLLPARVADELSHEPRLRRRPGGLLSPSGDSPPQGVLDAYVSTPSVSVPV